MASAMSAAVSSAMMQETIALWPYARRSPALGVLVGGGSRFAASLRDAAIAPFNVPHAPWDRSLVSYTFCSCSDCASVRNAVQRDGREGAHGLGR